MELFENNDLHKEIYAMIEASRRRTIRSVNSEMTMLYWKIGQRINEELLRHDRAEYGKAIVATLSPQLQNAYGKGFTESSLWRMIRFFKGFPEERNVAMLSQNLTWSHFTIFISNQRCYPAQLLRSTDFGQQLERPPNPSEY